MFVKEYFPSCFSVRLACWPFGSSPGVAQWVCCAVSKSLSVNLPASVSVLPYVSSIINQVDHKLHPHTSPRTAAGFLQRYEVTWESPDRGRRETPSCRPFKRRAGVCGPDQSASCEELLTTRRGICSFIQNNNGRSLYGWRGRCISIGCIGTGAYVFIKKRSQEWQWKVFSVGKKMLSLFSRLVRDCLTDGSSICLPSNFLKQFPMTASQMVPRKQIIINSVHCSSACFTVSL